MTQAAAASRTNLLRALCVLLLATCGAPRAFADDAPPKPENRGDYLPVYDRGLKGLLPLYDRWRIGYLGTVYDPYNQNPLKGDFPIIGQRTFLNFLGSIDTLAEGHNLPTPQGNSRTTTGAGGEFFGNGEQLLLNGNIIASLELSHGSTAYRPKDWSIKVTPVYNVNYTHSWENQVINIDIRRATTRFDHAFGLQEAFAEVRLLKIDKRFDFMSVRAGIQGFTSDFRGFIFSDNQPGLKLFGNFGNNRFQWNLAYFYMLEKDTNSRLNTFDFRHQHVGVANLYKQDFLVTGYTAQLSFHTNIDRAGSMDPNGQHYNTNGFLVRPANIGAVVPHDLQVYYIGFTGEGHFGRLNVTNAFYEVLGHDNYNPIANRPIDVNAQMAALELSYDSDWLRPKIFGFFASGAHDPKGPTANGFDSIVDNVDFAGSGFSFFNRQGIPLAETGVNIKSRFSLFPDLRSDKDEGQANFVNPGLLLVGAGLDAELTPKLRASLNVNVMWFVATEPLILILQQPAIGHYFGEDYALRFNYRPLLTNNIIITLGAGLFRPGQGFIDVQINQILYSAFLSLTLTY
jgi:hypothetical protein